MFPMNNFIVGFGFLFRRIVFRSGYEFLFPFFLGTFVYGVNVCTVRKHLFFAVECYFYDTLGNQNILFISNLFLVEKYAF